MGRVTGARNRDHHASRAELAKKVAGALLETAGTQPSLRLLAERVGVDAGTLRHYFTDRRGVVQAGFEFLLSFGAERRERARALGALPAREALKVALDGVVGAWSGALGQMHAAGFSEGMGDAEIGQTYVSTMLEPTIAAIEELLVIFHARGELTVPDARVAALALLSPVFVALFHQHQLQGRKCRPLELGPYVEAHLDGFFRGYAPLTSHPPKAVTS